MEPIETPTEEKMLEAFEQSHYDVAEICLNGHLINEYAATHGDENQPFCNDCGAATIYNAKNVSG
jgi:hypothetical protein